MKALALRLLLGFGAAFTLVPRAARAEILSGTIQYTGSQGPVSDSQPILVFVLIEAIPGKEKPVDAASVNTNGGTFSFDLPAGTYYLLYALDANNDGNPGIGEPLGLFDNQPRPPGNPITVPQSDLNLSFNDTGLIVGIAGTVTYTGDRGSVSASNRLSVLRFTDANLSIQPADNNVQRIQNNSDRYNFILVPTATETTTFYLLAFLDANGDGTLDAGDPFEIYSQKGATPGDPVVATATQTEINFTFGDENLGPIPTPSTATTPTPTQTATLTPTVTPISGTCVGDCDGGGDVTVNEIIILLNMALGTQTELSACPDGIPADIVDVSEINVTLIIQAVNNALNGCGV